MNIPLFGCSVAELADLPVPKFLFQLKKKIEKSPGKVGHSTICRWRDSFSSALCSEHSGKMNAHAQLICRFSEATCYTSVGEFRQGSNRTSFYNIWTDKEVIQGEM